MATIKKVVYKTEGTVSRWSDALGAHEDIVVFREDSWREGEEFKGEYIQGKISHIRDEVDTVSIYVDGKKAMSIMKHDVCRLYYGA